jgi:hypothetical protein
LFAFVHRNRVYVIDNPNASSNTLPMAILKPFGYSSSRTVLQICCFWIWLALGCLLHFRKWRITKQLNELYPLEDNEASAEKVVDETARDSAVQLEAASSGSETDKKSTEEDTQKDTEEMNTDEANKDADVENPSS